MVRRTKYLEAGQQTVLLPEGVFRIDPGDTPQVSGWYEIEYDPFGQFIRIVGKA